MLAHGASSDSRKQRKGSRVAHSVRVRSNEGREGRPMVNLLIALFALYVLATAWQGRRALATQDPVLRLREAKRLLYVSSLGVPLVGLLIIAVA